jgi:hypothetical protein
MSEFSLDNTLNDCIDQLANGRSVEDCLRLYPQHADDLRPMLEAGLLARRAQYNALEVANAQNRNRSRIVAAMMGRQLAPARRPSYGGWLRATAALVLVFAVVVVIAGASSGSLPGDPLYPVKRLTESAQLLFNNSAALREQFAQRRIDEISTLLAQGREAEVEFEGVVEAANGDLWSIAGLIVRVPSETPGTTEAQPGDRVHVRARTAAGRELVASAITLSEDGVLPLPPTFTPTPTESPTPRATPTLTPSPSPTITPSPSFTPTPTPTMTLIPDTDGDGMPDSTDLCPTVPGAVIANSCPLPTATPALVFPTATSTRPPTEDDGEDHGGNSGPGGGHDDGSGDDHSGSDGGDSSGPGGG